MKCLLIYFFIYVGYIHTVSISKADEEWDFEFSAKELIDNQWNEFKLTYQKHYATEAEELHRKKTFIENSIKISDRNQLFAKGLAPTAFGINTFSDLSSREFLNTYSNCRYPSTSSNSNASIFIPPAHITLAENVDWREKGAVTEAKTQGVCGSCYTFGATGSLEGQHFIRNGELISLSEQQLIDCSARFGNGGCCGGLEYRAYEYIKAAGGIATEKSYPYEERQYKCRYDSSKKAATDTGYKRVKGTEENLQKAVAAVGPITVGIAVTSSFQHFRPVKNARVYYEPSCNEESINHAVLVVGYGTDPDDKYPDYWIVKNSWGSSFCEDGFIRMARIKDNNCHIASDAIYPLV